jgi:hypothetical protein
MLHPIGIGTGRCAGATLDTKAYPLATGDRAYLIDKSITALFHHTSLPAYLTLHKKGGS